MKHSLVILALLGHISATQLKNTEQETSSGLEYPPDDILLQLDSGKHSKHYVQQVQDHEKDTDDLLEDNFVGISNKYNHENDTDDIPAGLEPVSLAHSFGPKQYYNENYVQLSDHHNDTDDVPENQDPIELSQKSEAEKQEEIDRDVAEV